MMKGYKLRFCIRGSMAALWVPEHKREAIQQLLEGLPYIEDVIQVYREDTTFGIIMRKSAKESDLADMESKIQEIVSA